MTFDEDPSRRLLSIKELADELHHPRSFVQAMKKRGFPMPGGRARLADAIAWIERDPSPRTRKRPEPIGPHPRA